MTTSATTTDVKSHLLTTCLQAAVPLRILEYRGRGGPGPEDVERARRAARTVAEKGDILMFRGAKPGQTAEVFNALADGLAVLAFCPGGVKFLGQHWEADRPPG
jgi:hypothetical protein